MAKFVFSVDSALLGELGEKLVSSVHVALTELVKNAYDADATKVSIKITEERDGSPHILIKDNGTGMTLEEVRSFWMKIGTSNKQRQPVSRIYGRPRTGAKGIGRFCCRRLGTKLKLETCARISKRAFEITEILFEWEQFIPGTDVGQVTCEGKTEVRSKAETGTTLTIFGAKDNQWRQRGFDYLRRQLAVLTANRGTHRKGFRPDPGFNIPLDAPGFIGGVGDLRDQVINATWGTLEGKLDAKGHAVYELTAKGLKTKKITSRKQFPHLQGVRVKLGIMVQNKDDFRNPRVLSKHSAVDIANEWGGVQLRYNGFRVIPYGDDDWLEIDRDRARRLGKPNDDQLFDFAHGLKRVDPSRSLLNMLSMKSYVGNIETDNRANGLIMKVDRQGLVENEAFQELKEFARFGIDWANIYRDFYVQSQITHEAGLAQQHLQTVLNRPVAEDELVPTAVNYLRKEIRSLTALLPEGERKEKQDLLLRTTRALEAGAEANLEKLRHLRLLASASTLTLLFSHEIKSLLGTLSGGAASIAALEKYIPKEHRHEVKRISGSLAEARSRFADLIEMTGIVGDVSNDAEATRLNLSGVIGRAVKCFSVIKEKYQIEINYDMVPRHLAVGPMIPGELYAVVLNVLSNAIKSVIAAGNDKVIEFDANRPDGERAVIHVRDTGIGLSEEHFDEVFRTFVSDPEGRLYQNLEDKLNPQDAQLFGTGSGLGLSIVRDIVTARKGTVNFQPPQGKWKVDLKIELP